MKQFIFNILTKYFGKELRQQIEDWYLSKEFPTYKVKNDDGNVQEKLTELWYSPEFKIWLKMLSNKRNYLGRKLLAMKHSTKDESAIEAARTQGQAFEISDQFAFLKYVRRLFQAKKNKKPGEK